jgi:Raf kinase inhibitor-like YbhB/YbcL family protein
MRRRPAFALLAAVCAAGAVLACSSSDGRVLPPPRDDQTTTTPSAPVVQPPVGSTQVFALTSEAFTEGAPIPARFTCTGDDLSPPLAWSGAPLDAAQLAIVVRDLSAGGFVHWVVAGVDVFVQGVGEDGLPEGAVEGRNSAGTVGWTGPCPPAGTGTHTYEFAVLALTEPIAVSLDAPADEVATQLETAAAERAILTGTVAAA